MNISIFEWAVQLMLDCIASLFQYFRFCLDAIGPAWSVIVSLLVVFLLFRFILLPLFGQSFNIGGGVSDIVKKSSSKPAKYSKFKSRKSSNHSNTKGGGS